MKTKRKNKYRELTATIAVGRNLEGGFHAQHVVLVGLTPEAQEQFAAAMRRLRQVQMLVTPVSYGPVVSATDLQGCKSGAESALAVQALVTNPKLLIRGLSGHGLRGGIRFPIAF